MRTSKPHQPGLVDVAARAQVSAGTASHVLNGNHKARISLATQERVRRAAQELGYRPNTFARSLLGKKTKTLGLMANNLDNPFFVSVAQAAWQSARAIGYEMLLDLRFTADGPFRDRQRPGTWPVDGLLLWAETVQDIELLLGREAVGLPAVYLGLVSDADCDAVTLDFYAGMRQVMDHITQKGYRNPVMIVPGEREGDTSIPRSRAHAFRDYCQERNFPGVILQLAAHLPCLEAALRCGVDLAAMPAVRRPDVAVCYGDLIAIGVYHGLRRGGMRVPQNVAVTGFDGLIEGQCLDLPLTSAAIPIHLACEAAIDLLVHRIEHGASEPTRRISLPISLITGATT